MKTPTKLIKSLLRRKFPLAHIEVRFRQASNYVDSSDKIIITIDEDYKEVHAVLTKYTRHISIYQQGQIASRWANCNPEIFDISTETWKDADVCEFIEVITNSIGTRK